MYKTWLIALMAVLSCYHSSVAAPAIPGIVATAPEGVRSVKVEQGYMVPYTVKMSDKVSFEMIPIPGGKFKLGSPATEAHRNDKDEGPVVEVEIAPFWIGKCEVTWAEYKLWMSFDNIFKNIAKHPKQAIPIDEKNKVDAVAAPSSLYDTTYTFEYGEDPELPAVTMSQFAARQYTKWLSQRTKQIFRLPNEAEWEYACRAGTTTAYSFGDDPKQLGDYAWTAENSDAKPHYVGKKKPNRWGLHDMHGNVMEWTLDAYTKSGYDKYADTKQSGLGLTNWPTVLFPRVLRGGSFEFESNCARSAARFPSDDKAMNETDPNRPRGVWWLTDDPCRSLGMRVIRPLAVPNAAELTKCWEVDNEFTESSRDSRFTDGKGSKGVVLPIAE